MTTPYDVMKKFGLLIMLPNMSSKIILRFLFDYINELEIKFKYMKYDEAPKIFTMLIISIVENLHVNSENRSLRKECMQYTMHQSFFSAFSCMCIFQVCFSEMSYD